MKSLLEIPPQTLVKISQIKGGKGARQNLSQLGIRIGSQIMIKRNAPFSGALLIQNQGTSVAIGRNIAAKIMVEEV